MLVSPDIYEIVASIPSSKTRPDAVLMFKHPAVEIACYSDIENVAQTAHDVDPGGLIVVL